MEKDDVVDDEDFGHLQAHELASRLILVVEAFTMESKPDRLDVLAGLEIATAAYRVILGNSGVSVEQLQEVHDDAVTCCEPHLPDAVETSTKDPIKTAISTTVDN